MYQLCARSLYVQYFILSSKIPLWRRSLVAQKVKNLPAMQVTWVPSLDWEDSPGEGNGYPLQYSFLESSMSRGAWWATVPRVEELDMAEWLTLYVDKQTDFQEHLQDCTDRKRCSKHLNYLNEKSGGLTHFAILWKLRSITLRSYYFPSTLENEK